MVHKALKRKVDVTGMREAFVEFDPFKATQAETAARLWERCRDHGMSLADRAGLSLAMELQLPVLTGGSRVGLIWNPVSRCVFSGKNLNRLVPGLRVRLTETFYDKEPS